MLGKLLEKSRSSISNTFAAAQSTKNYDLSKSYQNVSGAALPKAPANPYKKRPLKLKYDKNEFYAFRLPSEQHFLLGSFDHEDIFGKRKGINHSPHIRSQLDLDSNMVWLYLILTMLAFGAEFKNHDEFVQLR